MSRPVTPHPRLPALELTPAFPSAPLSHLVTIILLEHNSAEADTKIRLPAFSSASVEAGSLTAASWAAGGVSPHPS